MTTLLDVQTMETYVSGVTARAGVSVVWDKPKTTPRTNGKTIWLPKLTSSTTQDEIVALRYYLKHEVSHVQHSDFKFLNEKNPQGALALINNLLEDNRIDYLNDSVYAGDVVTSNAYWTQYDKRIAATEGEAEDQQRSVIAAFLLDALARDWFSTSHLVVSTLRSKCDDGNIQQLETLLDNGCLSELMALRTSEQPAEDTWTLALKVFAILFPDVDPESQCASKAPSEAQEGKPEDGEGEGGPSASERVVDVSKVPTAVEHEHTESRSGSHLEHEVTEGDYLIPMPKEYIINNFPLKGEFARFDGSDSGFSKREVNRAITNNAKPLANKLRIKLQTQSKGRYEYGQKRGKLHNGSLHKLLTDNVAASERIFRTHKVSDVTDTAVSLLVDCSGSMYMRKFELACVAAGALAEALKPLHIAYNVMGFTNHYSGDNPIIWNFSKFGENVPLPTLVDRFSTAANCLWENTDGDALVYAYHVLAQRKEHRKVLLVMSDGGPSGRGFAGDIVAYTHKVAKFIDTKCDLYGIGIMDSNVKKYYRNNVVVNDPDELASSVLSIIQRSIGV
jgi:nitric oxide reductase activation protein